MNEEKQRMAQAVKRARGSLSQVAFAKLLDVSRYTVQIWENGENMPCVQNQERIAHCLGLSLDDLRQYIKGEEVEETQSKSMEEILMWAVRLRDEEKVRLIKLLLDTLIHRS